MASITKQSNGYREVQFVGNDGKRRTIRLGKVDQKTAELVRVRIEELSSVRITGEAASTSTSQWLRSISDKLYDRLVRTGLSSPRSNLNQQHLTLIQMVDAYIKRRDDVKYSTKLNYIQAQNYLVEFFGENRVISTITVAEGLDFRRHLRHKFSDGYTAKIIVRARLFWRDAVDRGDLTTNIFSKVPIDSEINSKNHRFIDRQIIEKVISVCPDAQWKLLIALSRYAGLRCPSEHLALKWSDIDFKADKITVHASKTEHHRNKGIRVIPIFREIAPYLQAVYDERSADSDYVITKYRSANANLRTQFLRFINKAGLTSWPRLFHNLRASCQTDLAEQFPAHVVCEWIGNSEAVARAHYLQTTPDHFQKASGKAISADKALPNSDANSDAVSSGIDSQPVIADDSYLSKIREIVRIALGCESVQLDKWPIQDLNL